MANSALAFALAEPAAGWAPLEVQEPSCGKRDSHRGMSAAQSGWLGLQFGQFWPVMPNRIFRPFDADMGAGLVPDIRPQRLFEFRGDAILIEDRRVARIKLDADHQIVVLRAGAGRFSALWAMSSEGNFTEAQIRASALRERDCADRGLS
jgi:hypothetical protein